MNPSAVQSNQHNMHTGDPEQTSVWATKNKSVRAIHESPLHDIDHLSPKHKQKYRRKMLLSKIIGYFKMNSAKRINQIRSTTGFPV